MKSVIVLLLTLALLPLAAGCGADELSATTTQPQPVMQDAAALNAGRVERGKYFVGLRSWEHFGRELERGRNLIDAVAGADAEHFVLSSLPMPHCDQKYALEQYAKSFGIPSTFVHVAVEDIGGPVAAIFEQPDESIGPTIGIARDDAAPAGCAAVMSRVSGRSVQYGYRRFIPPRQGDGDRSRQLDPPMQTFEQWAAARSRVRHAARLITQNRSHFRHVSLSLCTDAFHGTREPGAADRARAGRARTRGSLLRDAAFPRAVEIAGARYVPYRHAMLLDEQHLTALFPERPKKGGLAQLRWDIRNIFVEFIPGALRDLEQELDREHADAIVGDNASAVCEAVSQRRNIPWAAYGMSVLAMPSVDTRSAWR